MPDLDLPLEVSSTLDGEGEIDELIRQQVAGQRLNLPEEFVERVLFSLEYGLQYRNMTKREKDSHRKWVHGWLNDLERGTNYRDFLDRMNRSSVVVERDVEEVKRANQRAEELLQRHLTAQQRSELKRRGYFHVTSGRKRYRITKGRSGNIKVMNRMGRAVASICVSPVGNVPLADIMLAQKLWLECCPKELLKIANVTKVTRRNSTWRPQVDMRRIIEDVRVAIELRRALRGGVERTGSPEGHIRSNGDEDGNHDREAEPADREVPGPEADARQDRLDGRLVR